MPPGRIGRAGLTYNHGVKGLPPSPYGPAERLRRVVVRAASHTTITGLLLVGFGLVFAFWIAAGVDVIGRFRRVDRELEGLTNRFLQTEEDLTAIRTGVFLGGLDVRDALLDTSEERTGAYRRQLQNHRLTSLEGLSRIRGRAETAEVRREFQELDREVRAYWDELLPLLAMEPPRRAAEARAVLVDRVIPKREQIVRIAQQFRSLNRARFQERQRDAQQLYGDARQRIWLAGGVALLLGVGVGGLVLAYAGHLERRLREQLERNTQNTRDLQRLSAQLVRAQEDERRLIARELHDEIGQALTAVKMQLALVRPGESAEASLAEVRRMADNALQTVRQLSRLLHPPMLDDTGLAPALQWYLNGFADRTGIAATMVQAGMEARLPGELETSLFLIVQEATTNVARHASARECRVYLQRLQSSVLLTVDDNGVGFDTARTDPARSGGLGLLGIRERVAGFRGTFRIESRPGHGTRLTVELPVDERTTDPHEGPSPPSVHPSTAKEAPDAADSAR